MMTLSLNKIRLAAWRIRISDLEKKVYEIIVIMHGLEGYLTNSFIQKM